VVAQPATSRTDSADTAHKPEEMGRFKWVLRRSGSADSCGPCVSQSNETKALKDDGRGKSGLISASRAPGPAGACQRMMAVRCPYGGGGLSDRMSGVGNLPTGPTTAMAEPGPTLGSPRAGLCADLLLFDDPAEPRAVKLADVGELHAKPELMRRMVARPRRLSP
jgi:hypothetical protein